MSVPASTPICPALVIDGSSACFFSGVLGGDGSWLACRKADKPALESLFSTVETVLKKAGLELNHIKSYIYCEGPGSLLGLRLCAMAIESWTRIHPAPTELYSFNSLTLLATQLTKEGGNEEDALLISDWKKDTWNSLAIRSGTPGRVKPIQTPELSDWQGPLYHLPARKGWQKPPDNALELKYAPERLAKLLDFPDLIQRRQSVELYNSAVSSFQKWTPERHRARPSA